MLQKEARYQPLFTPPSSSKPSKSAVLVIMIGSILSLLALLPLLTHGAVVQKRWNPTWSQCSTAPISSPDTDEALSQTPASVLSNLGPYSPFLSLESPICRNVPDGWTVENVQIIMRHGARNPTSNALKKILKSQDKVLGKSSSDSTFNFVETYKYNSSSPDLLTDFGRKQLYLAGKRYAAEYKDLSGNYFTRSDYDQRVVESGEFFLQGLQGGDFDLTATLPKVDVIITGDGLNDTLDQKACKAFENYDPDLGDEAEDNWLKVFAPPIAKRINDATGANVSGSDVTNLLSLCAFGGVSGQEWKQDPWCTAFTDDNWKGNEYFYDVSKFYGSGWGMPYSRVIATGWVNEIISRLTSKPVLEGSGTNSTLDGNPKTFPLDKTFYADFSHDNNMVPLLPALGLEWETLLPTKANLTDIPAHQFVVSEIVPFAARFVFEKLKSVDGQEFVRLIVNDRVVSWPYAGCGGFGTEYGMCEINAWLEAQSFAQQQYPVWDEVCNAPQINGTVAL